MELQDLARKARHDLEFGSKIGGKTIGLSSPLNSDLSASSFLSSGFSTQFPVAQPKPISSACGGLDSSSTHHILGSSRVSPIRPVTASLSFAEVVQRAPKLSANTGGPQCKSTGQATLVMGPKHSRSGYTASRFNTSRTNL